MALLLSIRSPRWKNDQRLVSLDIETRMEPIISPIAGQFILSFQLWRFRCILSIIAWRMMVIEIVLDANGVFVGRQQIGSRAQQSNFMNSSPMVQISWNELYRYRTLMIPRDQDHQKWFGDVVRHEAWSLACSCFTAFKAAFLLSFAPNILMFWNHHFVALK